MKVVRLESPVSLDRIALTEEGIRQPRADEVLVRVGACALNFRDLFVLRGDVPVQGGRVPLSDGAGDIVAVGDAVEAFQVGDSVVSTFYPRWSGGDMTEASRRDVPGDSVDGFASEYVCAPARAFTKAPRGYTHVEASTLTCAAVTAWRGLVVCGRVALGDTVLVLGTGGVSLFALQFAKAAGAYVVATSSSDQKLAKLKALGADLVVNYKEVPDWGDEIKRLTGGRGVDHVMEVGGPATLAQSIRACRIGGHIALIGVLTGFASEVFLPAVFSNQIRISGVSIGSRADQAHMIRAIEAHRLRPIIDRCFPFDQFVPAIRYYESQRHFGKVCIQL